MLIQLGLYFIEKINEIHQESGFEFIDIKEDTIKIEIENVDNKIKKIYETYKKNYKDCNIKEENLNKKYLTDKSVLLEALNILKENYLKYGEAKV